MTVRSAWTMTRILDATAKIMDYRGRTPKKLGMDWGDGRIPAISARNVRMGRIDFDKEHYVASDLLYRRWMTQGHMEQGDTLITTEAPLGNVAAVPDSRRYVLSQRTVLLRPSPDLFDKTFFTQVMQSPAFQLLLTQNASGSTALGIQRKKLEQLYIPTPPLDEQRRIANALRDADELIATVERFIAKKQAIKQGMMQQLLTGRTRLPGFTEPWSEASIYKLANDQRMLFNDGDWIESEHITTTGSRLLQTGNIGVGRLLERGTKRYVSDESFLTLKCKEVVPGDILICRLAEPAGRACIVTDIGEERMLTSVDVTIYRPDPSLVDRRFLVAFFSTPKWFQEVAERCGGSTRTRIARSELGRIQIPLPSIEEQKQIADALTDVDSELGALESRLIKARAVKSGMMQELVTGRTRLPVEVAS